MVLFLIKAITINNSNNNIKRQCASVAKVVSLTGTMQKSDFDYLSEYANQKGYLISVKVLSKENKDTNYDSINNDLSLNFKDALYIQYNGGIFRKGYAAQYIKKVN